MISAARGQTAPVQAAWTGPFSLVWPPVSVPAHAFIIRMALRAYFSWPVMCHASAWE